MKIAVVGAGIIGVTTAHALLENGHEVTVIDRATSAAEGASFANTGMLSTSLSNLLAHPNRPADQWFHRFGRIDNLHTSGLASFRFRKWLMHWKRPPSLDGFSSKLEAAQKLVSMSPERLLQAQGVATPEHEKTEGTLILLNTKDSLTSIQPKLDFLRAKDIKFQLLNEQEVKAKEPSMSPKIEHLGGIFFPADTVHNCRQFALQLRSHLLRSGVKFLFNHEVSGLTTGPRPGLNFLNQPSMDFDHVVICTGLMPSNFTESIKCRLPVTPLLGWSLSAPLREPTYAPHTTVIDPSNGLTIGRIGNRMRVSGGFSLGAASETVKSKTVKSLFSALQQYFPGSAQLTSGTQTWNAHVGSLPDGLPAIGPAGPKGIWLNMAHGMNGWGMAYGAAEVVSAMISNQPVPMDATPFHPDRF